MKTIAAGAIALIILAVVAFGARWHILAYGMALAGQPDLVDSGQLGPDTEWFDDYYTVQRLDERTFAIAEPRYWQKNVNYLIVGTERAILFDAGPGLRDIRPVVSSLTRLPITFIPSHLHYDHTGNVVQFDRVALLALPELRARAQAAGGSLKPDFLEHLGTAEGFDVPALPVSEWLHPGDRIDLGDRRITVVYTPGHTMDSVSLVDSDAGFVFAGDFLGPYVLGEFTPGGGMGDYLQGIEALLQAAPADARVFAAHPDLADMLDPFPPGAPEVTMQHAREVRSAFLAIRDGRLSGQGLYPVTYSASPQVKIMANPSWMQDWTPRHPESVFSKPRAPR